MIIEFDFTPLNPSLLRDKLFKGYRPYQYNIAVIVVNCPYCGYNDSKVIDSRDVDEGVRRRRQCLSCQKRFTTYERLQPASLFVIKKDRRREEYNRDKLLSGVRKACEKRPLPTGTIEKVVDEIESGLYRLGQAEISSKLIGDMVMEKLKDLDYIAYIRFASVYREFTDIQALKEAVDNLAVNQRNHLPGQLPLIPKNDGAAISNLKVKK